MQSNVQRRRQLGVLRPRQARNDVNAGATPTVNEPTVNEQPAPTPSDSEASPQEREDLYAKRCAQRHLI